MNEKIHIGKKIQERMKEDRRTARWLAEQIHCDRSNIYRIYQRQHIDIEQLVQICIHLNVDLFTHYSEYIQKQIQKKNSTV